MQKPTCPIYHTTLRSVVESIEAYIIANGYEVPETMQTVHYWQAVGYGETFRDNLELADTKNNGVSFQIYRMDSGNYELNMYFWK